MQDYNQKIAIITPIKHLGLDKLIESKRQPFYLENGTKEEVKLLMLDNLIDIIICNPNKQEYRIDPPRWPPRPQDGPQDPQHSLQDPQDGPQAPQQGPQDPQHGPQDPPKAAQKAPKGPQRPPKGPQKPTKRPPK